MSSTANLSSFSTLDPIDFNLKSGTSASSAVPVRNGLPTPPSDMTGVTYNAMPPVAYGKPNGMPAHLYGNSRPFDSISSSMMAAMKPQSHASSAKESPPAEPVAQKKSSNSRGSQLRIPSSINNSKGNLAEFAAQVWIHCVDGPCSGGID